jgi:hypothetical protein
MIVRIMGDNQYRMTDEQMRQFDLLDNDLEAALNDDNNEAFQAALKRLTDYVHENGRVVPMEELVQSDLIVPAADMSLAEARQHFTPFNMPTA